MPLLKQIQKGIKRGLQRRERNVIHSSSFLTSSSPEVPASRRCSEDDKHGSISQVETNRRESTSMITPDDISASQQELEITSVEINYEVPQSTLQTTKSPNTADEAYIYGPLDKTSDTIRLARLISVDDNSIHISLQTFSLCSAPKFEALSYEWGSPVDLKTIFVNDKPLPIQQNLWNGLQALWRRLRRFADFNRSSLFWADALCIDQGNVAERSHQVNMMASIYSSAAYVEVWLGPGTPDSDKAMEYLSEQTEWIDIPAGDAEPKFSRETFEALIALLERPYWRRLWIVQELLMARNISILCGDRILRMDRNSVIPRLFQHSLGTNSSLTKLWSTPGYNLLRDVSSKRTRKSGRNFGVIISKYGTQECADVRDRIFGLLGLIDFKGQPPLMADYSLSREELCQLVSSYISQTLYAGAKNEFWEKRLRKLLELDGNPPAQLIPQTGNQIQPYQPYLHFRKTATDSARPT